MISTSPPFAGVFVSYGSLPVSMKGVVPGWGTGDGTITVHASNDDQSHITGT